ncbi:MAG TPA: hypothetical protein VLT16_13750 [Candidatus Limnocylindrales bacterium]|nr:hypothetical protein [Candidatus Limnocylindrales bacterium]
MKNKNQRELEKQWAKEAVRKAKPARKKGLVREDRNQAAVRKAQQTGVSQTEE